jgi:hypothetical protein
MAKQPFWKLEYFDVIKGIQKIMKGIQKIIYETILRTISKAISSNTLKCRCYY